MEHLLSRLAHYSPVQTCHYPFTKGYTKPLAKRKKTAPENTKLGQSEGTYCQAEQHLKGKKRGKEIRTLYSELFKNILTTEKAFKHLKKRTAFDV